MSLKQWKTFGVAVGAMTLSMAAQAADFVVEQSNKTFVMDGQPIEHLTIKAGDTVHFKNADPFFHNIFSLSDLKTFDLGSYPAGEEKSVTFESPGEAEIECAIHPEMYMVIEVQ